MALGLGVASVRGDKNSQEDSFGLIALCSVGPILAVLFLGISSEDYIVETQHTAKTIKENFTKHSTNLALKPKDSSETHFFNGVI